MASPNPNLPYAGGYPMQSFLMRRTDVIARRNTSQLVVGRYHIYDGDVPIVVEAVDVNVLSPVVVNLNDTANIYTYDIDTDTVTILATASVNTIYTADSTVTSNRTVDINGKYINFTNGNVGFNKATPNARVHVIPGAENGVVIGDIANLPAGAFPFAIATTDAAMVILFSPADVSNVTTFRYNSFVDVNGYSEQIYDGLGNVLIKFDTRPAIPEKFQVYDNTATLFFTLRNDKRIVYVDGNQAAGFVMTSDGSGVATWQAPSAAGIPITANYIPQGTGASITDGTWAFSGNDIYPLTDGANIGITGTNRPGTIFMASGAAVDYASTLVFSELGTERARFLNGGNFGLNTATPSAKLHVKGTTSDNTTYAAKFTNSTASSLLFIRNDGFVGIGEDAGFFGGSLQLGIKNISGSSIIIDVYNSVNSPTLQLFDNGRIHFSFEDVTASNVAVEFVDKSNNQSFFQLGTGETAFGWTSPQSVNFSIKNKTNQAVVFQITDNAGTTNLFNVSEIGNVGIGGGTFGTSAQGVFAIYNRTAPTAAAANAIQIFSKDSVDSTATLGLYLEQVVEAGIAVASTSKLKTWINGVAYYILLTAV